MSRVACFVSSHGFGHAARACAVLAALARRRPKLGVTVFSATPAWFFHDSLGPHLAAVVDELVDPGLVQHDALRADLAASAARLAVFAPPPATVVERLARQVRRLGCVFVLCDVAPLGIAVARRAGVPSVLVENFTWDWILRAYAGELPELGRVADRLAPLFAAADLHLQTEPCCAPLPGTPPLPPIARRPRESRDAIRRRLGIPGGEPAVLVTMGGIPWRHLAPPDAAVDDGGAPWLILPGDHPRIERRGRAVFLPHRSGFFHPDLVRAVDAVVGKLGYSTVAEVASAGIPLGYVPRPDFPESPVLERWVREHLPCRRIDPRRFVSGRWHDVLGPLLALPSRPPTAGDGAEDAATRLEPLLDR